MATFLALAAALIFLGAGTLPADAASRFTSTPTPKIIGLPHQHPRRCAAAAT